MRSRREFLKDAATGAAMLGSSAAANAMGIGGMLGQRVQLAKSSVIIARDSQLHSQGASKPDEKRTLDLLDRAITAYTGHANPVDSWKHIIAQRRAQNQVIGLKTNGLGGQGISTHAVLVVAIAERLQQAGVKAGNILVWDRNARDLEACGLTINSNPARIRCYGSDSAGFEDAIQNWGTAHPRFSRILTRECAMVINLPILKDHSGAGVTFAMKNMYGVVERPQDLHANGCNPGVADLNCCPAIREKFWLTIGDAMSSVYEGGPGFRPEHLWYPNTLMVSDDWVALDQIAWNTIEKKRAEAGLATLEAAGRPPRYIATAADADHRLGVNDPKRIHVVEV